MNPPPAYRDAAMERQHYPSVATGFIHNRVRTPRVKLWGGEVRRNIGVLQTIFGVIELLLGILVILLPGALDDLDYFGWGIWNGVLAIVTGSLGVCERRTKGVARTYMGASITTAILCADCFMYAAIGVLFKEGILYIIMCFLFFIQTAISIIGASVTGGALCSTTDQAHQVIDPPSYPQVVLEDQQHLSVTQGFLDSTTRSDRNVWRVNERRIIGTCQIAIGGMEVILGIVVIFVPDSSFFASQDYVGWGIWHGLLAILSGSLGVFHARKKCVVIAYTITSIITAVLCAGCLLYAVIGAYREGYGDTKLNVPIYIFLGILFFTQMMFSVTGIISSCDALSFHLQQAMNRSNNPEMTWESQQTSFGALSNSARPDDKLWGANVRRIMGILQYMFGGIECALATVVIRLPECYFFYSKYYFGWGVTCGVFTILSGFLGVFSAKKKCVVTTYMMASITTAVMCGYSLAYVLIESVLNAWFKYESCSAVYPAIHISLCILLFIQVIISGIGAGFSCVIVGSTTHQPQQPVAYIPLQLSQQEDPAPSYFAVTSQTTTPRTSGTLEIPTKESCI